MSARLSTANIADGNGGPTIDQPKPEHGNVTERRRRSLEQACLAARIADDYRGKDTRVFDLTKVTPVFDYFVITTATSRRQAHAIADEVNRRFRELGSSKLGTEGYESGDWILVDYGDIVLHVFMPDTRTNYDLEHLWADAETIDWSKVPAP